MRPTTLKRIARVKLAVSTGQTLKQALKAEKMSTSCYYKYFNAKLPKIKTRITKQPHLETIAPHQPLSQDQKLEILTKVLKIMETL